MACKHQYRYCDQAHYVVCADCGTYHSLVAPPPADVYTADYWTHERGHSTMEEQVYNCETHEEGGKSKNAFLLDRIEANDFGAALEIGCAPGILLKRLYDEKGFTRTVGLEMSETFAPSIRKVGHTGPLFFGAFPVVTHRMNEGMFSLIIASDVFEHSHEPEAFLAECARLLKPGSQLLMMLPLAMNQLKGTRFFEPREHVYIHSPANLSLMLTEAGFGPIAYDRWTLGHDTVSARRKA